jgi:hypothetical protein
MSRNDNAKQPADDETAGCFFGGQGRDGLEVADCGAAIVWTVVAALMWAIGLCLCRFCF